MGHGSDSSHSNNDSPLLSAAPTIPDHIPDLLDLDDASSSKGTLHKVPLGLDRTDSGALVQRQWSGSHLCRSHNGDHIGSTGLHELVSANSLIRVLPSASHSSSARSRQGLRPQQPPQQSNRRHTAFTSRHSLDESNYMDTGLIFVCPRDQPSKGSCGSKTPKRPSAPDGEALSASPNTPAAGRSIDGGSVQYIEEEGLVPISPAPTINTLTSILSKLCSVDWRLQFESLTDLRRISKHHTSLLTQPLAPVKSNKIIKELPFLHQACSPLLTDLVDSLRSNVAKNAMLALHDLFCYVGVEMGDPLILEPALNICLRKAGAPGAGSFLIAEAERCLRQICCSVAVESRLIGYLLKNLKTAKQSQKLKTTIAQCLCLIILRLNAALTEVLTPKDIDALTGCVLKLTAEASAETRRYGKLAVCYLYEFLSALDNTKLRQLLTEGDLKELLLAARTASRTLDVESVLGVPLGSFHCGSSNADTEMKDSNRFTGAKPQSRPVTPPQTRCPSKVVGPTGPTPSIPKVVSTLPFPVIVTPEQPEFPRQPNTRTTFAWKRPDDGKSSVLMTPRMTQSPPIRTPTSSLAMATGSDRRAWTPVPRNNRHYHAVAASETRNSSVAPSRRCEGQSSREPEGNLLISFKGPEQLQGRRRGEEDNPFTTDPNHQHQNFSTPTARSRSQLKPIVISHASPRRVSTVGNIKHEVEEPPGERVPQLRAESAERAVAFVRP